MKNSLNKRLLSILLITSVTCADASIFNEPPPNAVSNKMLCISFQDRKAEFAVLTKGISALSMEDYDGALDYFKEAIGYGSPLGYFYASVLEPDHDTKQRYWDIACRALEKGAILEADFLKHKKWLLSLK